MATAPGKKTEYAWPFENNGNKFWFVGNGPKPSQEEFEAWMDKYRVQASLKGELFVDYDVERSQPPH